MRKLLKLLLTFLALTVLLNACSRHPKPDDASAELQRKVVGTWSPYKISENGNESTYGDRVTIKMLITPDGGFTTTVTRHPKNSSAIMAGTWTLTNILMTATVTNASGEVMHEPVGTVDHFKILRLDEHEMVYQHESGQTIFLKRIQ